MMTRYSAYLQSRCRGEDSGDRIMVTLVVVMTLGAVAASGVIGTTTGMAKEVVCRVSGHCDTGDRFRTGPGGPRPPPPRPANGR